MSDELFDVAFSGQVSEGADREAVKARIGKMFKAEGAKLEQLFSGKRIVVKRNVDRATADKFIAAFRSAGAEAEVLSNAPAPPEPAPVPSASSGPLPSTAPVPDAGEPPSTAPLGVTAEQINDLQATLAAPGEVLRDQVDRVPEPEYDLSSLEMAPVGSDLSDDEKESPPPPPDSSRLSLAD